MKLLRKQITIRDNKKVENTVLTGLTERNSCICVLISYNNGYTCIPLYDKRIKKEENRCLEK